VKYLRYLSKENVHETDNLSNASLSEEFRYKCTYYFYETCSRIV